MTESEEKLKCLIWCRFLWRLTKLRLTTLCPRRYVTIRYVPPSRGNPELLRIVWGWRRRREGAGTHPWWWARTDYPSWHWNTNRAVKHTIICVELILGDGWEPTVLHGTETQTGLSNIQYYVWNSSLVMGENRLSFMSLKLKQVCQTHDTILLPPATVVDGYQWSHVIYGGAGVVPGLFWE